MTNLDKDLLVKANELNNQLKAWAKSYYVKDKPEVPDAVYDHYYRELKEIEQQLGGPIEGSITTIIGGEAVDSLKKVKHPFPMLSIKTIMHDETEALNKWAKTYAKDQDLCVEHKYDGLAVRLRYESSRLVLAATRGDQSIGEDITHNIFGVGDIPFRINLTDVEVRGEVVMPISVFKSLNAQLAAEGKETYANPRNAAAGALRQLKPDVCFKRGLVFKAYGIYFHDGTPVYGKQTLALLGLEELGFKTGNWVILNSIGMVDPVHKAFSDDRPKLDYEIDGIVIKVDDTSTYERLGVTGKEPNWAVAYKFPPEQAITRLNGIAVSLGRTGKLTPVAELEPVTVGGVRVSSAILHNVFDLRKRGVRVGDSVIVQRAGDVIPEIVGVAPMNKRAGYIPNFKMPSHCPSCGGEVRRTKGESHYYCISGAACPAQLSASLAHYAGRSAMNILGFGETLAINLVEKGLVKTIADIYKLKPADFLSIEGFAAPSASKIYESIHRASLPSLEKFLFALGVRGMGESTARDIAKHFKRLEDVASASVEDLMQVPDVGPTTALNIAQHFANPINQQIISEILDSGVKVQEYHNENLNPVIADKIFVVTGSFTGALSRKDIETKLRAAGAKVQGSVSKNTDYLVLGDNPGAGKTDKAKELGTAILTAEQVQAMLAIS